jgi:hypothetical protein
MVVESHLHRDLLHRPQQEDRAESNGARSDEADGDARAEGPLDHAQHLIVEGVKLQVQLGIESYGLPQEDPRKPRVGPEHIEDSVDVARELHVYRNL